MRRFFIQGVVAACAAGAAFAQAQQNTTTYAYDVQGNLTEVKNGLQNKTTHQYDVLSRRVRTIDPVAGDGQYTDFTYDALDQLIKVDDARRVVTEYDIDGMGNLLLTKSLDTGTTTYQRDAAGNVTSQTDAKQQVTSYQYDDIDRIVLITYHDGTTASFLYDQTTNATGKLSKVTDISGTINYDYDSFGRLRTEVRVIGGVPFSTVYRYDDKGRLAGMDYPTGRAINYQYDPQGRVSGIDTVLAGAVTPVVTAVTYDPFGPVRAITFSNGRSHARSFDLDGRMSSYSLSSQTIAIGYDAAGRIKSTGDTVNLSGATNYGYDAMDRLTTVQTPLAAQSYEYDAVGNRKKKINGSASASYAYAGPGNRLTAVGAQAIATDVNGSITHNGAASFNYDARGRMISANTAIGLVQYTINALGQRVRKVTPTETTVFHYDYSGKLIAESILAGGKVKKTEHVYLGDIPVAVLK